jgi:hypothetical protein
MLDMTENKSSISMLYMITMVTHIVPAIPIHVYQPTYHEVTSCDIIFRITHSNNLS